MSEPFDISEDLRMRHDFNAEGWCIGCGRREDDGTVDKRYYTMLAIRKLRESKERMEMPRV